MLSSQILARALIRGSRSGGNLQYGIEVRGGPSGRTLVLHGVNISIEDLTRIYSSTLATTP
jgi:hypothetical protein